MATSDIELYPVLTDDQINLLKEYGRVIHVSKGEFIIKRGDRTRDFYIVLEGELSVLDEHLNEIVTHSKGEFTGNTDEISTRSSIFNARAKTDASLVQIANEKLKKFISKNYELSELLLRTFLLRRVHEVEQNIGAIKVLGSRYCTETFEIRSFLSKNHIQFDWVELHDDAISIDLLRSLNKGAKDVPLVVTDADQILIRPSRNALADALGLSNLNPEEIYDLIVVGAGPAGLAASVYAASEGLRVITVDSEGPGGQAGTSSKIENYLGFPTGISGSDLAKNAFIQAQKFGCKITVAHSAKKLTYSKNQFTLYLASGDEIKGRSIIAATGARYKKLPLTNLSDFEGKGVYYGATNMEAQTIEGKEVVIVGGGNSAGQAAMFLAERSSKVYIVIRAQDLTQSMSDYLISRIVGNPRIQIIPNTEVIQLNGNYWLESIKLKNKYTLEESTFPIANLFIFLGASPCSDWLEETTCLDENGFVPTGRDLTQERLESYDWPYASQPQSLETCIPGLFAVGDIRSGSVKRVASAVGEGAMAVSQVHNFLGRLENNKVYG